MANHTVNDIIEGIGIGSVLSVTGAALMPEAIHGFFVVLTGLVTAAAVFFLNRFLRKKFPDEQLNKQNDGKEINKTEDSEKR